MFMKFQWLPDKLLAHPFNTYSTMFLVVMVVAVSEEAVEGGCGRSCRRIRGGVGTRSVCRGFPYFTDIQTTF